MHAPRRTLRFSLAALAALASASAAGPEQPETVRIRVDAARSVGEMRPIGA